MSITTVNPATGQELQTYQLMDRAQAMATVETSTRPS